MFKKSQSHSDMAKIENLLSTLLKQCNPEYSPEQCLLRGQKIQHIETLQHTTTQILDDLKQSTINQGHRIGNLETFQGYVEKQEVPIRIGEIEHTIKDLSKSFEQLNKSLINLVQETTKTNKQTTQDIADLNTEFKESLQKIVLAIEQPKVITNRIEKIGIYILQACLLGFIIVMFEVWKTTP